MRPIYQVFTPTTASFNFPVIVPDVMLTPGNATWIVSNNSSPGVVFSLYFSNDDPFAPKFDPVTNATWVEERAAFQDPTTGNTTATVTLSNASAVGAYAYLPRIMQFRATNCANATITVRFVQASGGRS